VEAGLPWETYDDLVRLLLQRRRGPRWSGGADSHRGSDLGGIPAVRCARRAAPLRPAGSWPA